MRTLYFITHPNVVISRDVPVPAGRFRSSESSACAPA